MAGLAIFLGFCIAAVPVLIFVFVALWRDQKHACRCTCQVTGIRTTTLVKEPAKRIAVISTATTDSEEIDDVPVVSLRRN